MAKISSFRQFLILMYKGALLRKRHYIITFFEIVVSVFIASIFPMIESEVRSQAPQFHADASNFGKTGDWVNSTTYKPYSPYNYTSYYDIYFVYTPADNVTRDFMESTVNRFVENTGDYKARIKIVTHGVDSEDKLEKYCLNQLLSKETFVIIGTIFNSFHSTQKELPLSLDYKIRYAESYSSSYDKFKTSMKYRANTEESPHDDPIYRYTNFLPWQTSVEETFIEAKMNKSGNKQLDYKVYMQRFPFPEHKRAGGQVDTVALTPILIVYGYFVFMINIIRRIIDEKSNGSKELMKMMGMTDTVYWISTFTNYFIVGLVTVLCITIIYKAPLKLGYVFLANTDFFLLFLLLLIFVVSLILYCMAFTIFFNRAVFAIIAFIIVWDLSFTLIMQTYFLGNIMTNYFDLPLIAKLGICLLPTGSLLTMFSMISIQRQWGDGLTWSNMTDYPVSPDISLAMVLATMVFACFLYSLIIWYFDKVWPWQPGVPQPFYFMFTKNYWCGSKQKEKDDLETLIQKDQNQEYFEEEPSGTLPGVEIRNLSKAFQVNFQTKMAVNNLSLNIYQGQITALLGHNGAGKTTTINILTGLYTPSNGTAFINGSNILTNTSSARRGLGVCPQHNVLQDTLTVEEHLKIYAGLKGVTWKELQSEAQKAMEILKLTDKRNELVKNLSGGMKRKLSLGNAIVGGSKVLFLDEPTSGMDVEARRSVWDVLLDIRHDRTIILTTHYMEEADILGDRIAIMAEGEVQCCGSPMFLKRKFGTGYHLHMVKNSGFDLSLTDALLKKHIPEIKTVKELENEISYNLSSNSGTVFGEMFEDLERSKEKLGINSCGITVTTMEDVFLRVSNMSDMKYSKKSERSLQNGVSFDNEDVYGSCRGQLTRSIGHQFFALLEKRFHYTKRHWSILITQLVIPFLLICWCFISIKSIQGKLKESYEPINLDIKSVYGYTDSFYYSTTEQELTDKAVKVLKENNANAIAEKNPTHHILDYGKADLNDYLKKLMVGASVDKLTNGTVNLTAWYNGEPYHALPMSLLLMHTAVLQYVSTDEANILLTNAPLPKYKEQNQYGNNGVEGPFGSVFISLALGFMAATAVLVPIHERTTKAQLLQLMTGVSHVLYWSTMFVWDFLLFFIVSILLIIPFAIFYNYVFFGIHYHAILTLLLILWLYGISSIPLSYMVSLIFKKGNTGFSVVTAMSAILGIALQSILSTAYLATFGATKTAIGVCMWIFRIFPYYSAASALSNLFTLAYKNAYCEGIPADELAYSCMSENIGPENSIFQCCKNICNETCLKQTPLIDWDRNSCGRDILFLAIDGVLYCILLLLIPTSQFQKLCRLVKLQFMKLKKNPSVGQINVSDIIEDEDVINEENRVHNLYYTHGSIGNEALVTMDLSKIFKNFYAVEKLSMGIHQEECFGLLGINGAGKTTTFRMLTGDCHPTSGNALTTYSSLLADTKKFQSFLGYCPQFDALIDRLTGRETLTLFGRLRGLTGVALRDTIDKLIRMTDLTDHVDKQTRFYSGGNKRKLSVAVALIGSPPIILLDEPTAGVDPVSRRKIWNILAQARNYTKAAVLLTTHSMEESEALCSRLAIMVNGRFRCLGSIQQLKAKFGQGHTLIIKIKKEASENQESVLAIKAFIGNRLRGAELKDDHQGMLQYHITDPSLRLSQLFKLMEEMKTQFDLEDYLISDTSLEQIFLTFARSQRMTE